jgi:hypothetical protein
MMSLSACSSLDTWFKQADSPLPIEVQHSGGGEILSFRAHETSDRLAISSASNFITIGSTKSDVVRIQGTPTKIADLSFINQEMWNYGYYNRITFKNGRVSEWNNSDGKLKVRMEFE